MSITVTTPTGHIGSALTDLLLQKNEPVTLIARHPEKVARFAERGAKIIEGSHGDTHTVIAATRDTDALFVLVPPDFSSNDMRAHYRRFGEAAAAAVRENNIPHVVLLSSIGADLESGNGPIAGLFDIEAMLDKAAKNVVKLRPGYFMENTLMQIAAIKTSGRLFTTFDGESPVPMVSTRDIAERAAGLLIERGWSGHPIIEVQGPEDVSYNQVATILSETLNKEVQHVSVSPSKFKESLLGMGASEHVADLFNEMGASMKAGRITFKQPRNENTWAPTTYATFAREVFKGAYEMA
jgi:uncharacterized protein YbjT (DUF2867 family)